MDPAHEMKEVRARLGPVGPVGPVDYDEMLPMNPSLRDNEYLAHSHLLGNMFSPYLPSK